MPKIIDTKITLDLDDLNCLVDHVLVCSNSKEEEREAAKRIHYLIDSVSKT
ncbi:MAG: hypothetical protein WC444_05735 [Candidatus Paceibacterota bacterium]